MLPLALLLLQLVAPAAAVDLSGAVLEDVDGDGDLADAVGLVGVAVAIWQDGGDGVPDGVDDTLISGLLTGVAGDFAATGLADNQTYWVTADSRTVAPSAGFFSGYGQGDVWAEQSWGAAGSWCADGVGGTAVLNADGPCFGGRNARRNDDATTLGAAEHLVRVDALTTAVTGVDLAFSFELLTRMGDDDEDLASNRFAQGTLRQYFVHANAVDGYNTMRFTPVEPPNVTGTDGPFWSNLVTK